MNRAGFLRATRAPSPGLPALAAVAWAPASNRVPPSCEHPALSASRRHSGGFTLVEFALVILVIGLVVGGVVIGRELIRSAQMRAFVSQVGALDTAVTIFKSKYDCIPGDCEVAVDLELGEAGGEGDDGNGNGAIDVVTNLGTDIGVETRSFWYHLGRAGLLATPPAQGTTPGINSPPLALPGNGVGAFRAGGLWLVNQYRSRFLNNPGFEAGELIEPAWLTVTDTRGTEVVGPYFGSDASAIDSKMDDGFPARGNIQMSNGTHSLRCTLNTCQGLNFQGPGTGQADSCYDDRSDVPLYNLSTLPRTPSSAAYCTLIIKARF